MHEIKNLNSFSLFVGTGECNARCKHCAGMPLRKYAPKSDGEIDEGLIYETIDKCYDAGARYLSISSSGEPTLSPLSLTKALRIVNDFESNGKKLSPINLYSNGIRIGSDEKFSKEYLSLWKNLGLTTIYITVHDIDEENNARIYGVEKYPSLDKIIYRIHENDLLMRANLILGKENISTFDRFELIAEGLRDKGVNALSAWPIRGLDDKVDLELSPSEKELDKISEWAYKNQSPEFKIRILREKDKIVYKTGKKLTLFPNGKLSNSWCN